MERCTAAILLMFSLEALVAGRLSYAVADDGVDTIRLPSHGLADELETAARETGGEKKRPWKCCDVTQCNRRMPPGCRCMDAVERCDDACIRCQAHPSVSSKLICMDRFIGFDTGPSCTKPGNAVGDDVPNGPGVAGQEATAAVAATEELEARPWKCCDDTVCTKSAPPTCQCLDKVKKCAKTCKVCKKDGASSRYVCQDRYFGWPGPKCTKSAASGSISPEEHVAGRCRWPNCVDEDSVPNGIAARQHVTVAAAAAATEKEAVCEDSIAGGVEEARPWKCCDDTLCTRSAPPTCQCLDKVKKCAKTCKVCEKVGGSNGASSRYVCKDRYFGWPGPKCSKSVAADDRRGN